MFVGVQESAGFNKTFHTAENTAALSVVAVTAVITRARL
jgi:hypothetical protein